MKLRYRSRQLNADDLPLFASAERRLARPLNLPARRIRERFGLWAARAVEAAVRHPRSHAVVRAGDGSVQGPDGTAGALDLATVFRGLSPAQESQFTTIFESAKG